MLTYLGVCHGACFTQAIGLVDLDVEAFVHCVDKLFGKWRCPTRDHFNRG